jgi:hypothetical protein
MRIQDYIEARDQYIQTEVYAELRDHLKKAGISPEQCDEMVKSAFTRAGQAWGKMVNKHIIDVLHKYPLHNRWARAGW